jgi:hypothetical protein
MFHPLDKKYLLGLGLGLVLGLELGLTNPLGLGFTINGHYVFDSQQRDIRIAPTPLVVSSVREGGNLVVETEEDKMNGWVRKEKRKYRYFNLG